MENKNKIKLDKICIKYSFSCKKCPKYKKCEEELNKKEDKKMLKTCSKCGIVSQDHVCPYRKYKTKSKDSKANKFRGTKAWTNKSIEIRQRDRYLCVVCINNLYNTINTYNYDKLEVHHITPIEDDYNKRLDNNNLITLCNYHHKLAEAGEIPKEELYKLLDKE